MVFERGFYAWHGACYFGSLKYFTNHSEPEAQPKDSTQNHLNEKGKNHVSICSRSDQRRHPGGYRGHSSQSRCQPRRGHLHGRRQPEWRFYRRGELRTEQPLQPRRQHHLADLWVCGHGLQVATKAFEGGCKMLSFQFGGDPDFRALVHQVVDRRPRNAEGTGRSVRTPTCLP